MAGKNTDRQKIPIFRFQDRLSGRPSLRTSLFSSSLVLACRVFLLVNASRECRALLPLSPFLSEARSTGRGKNRYRDIEKRRTLNVKGAKLISVQVN